MKFWATFAAFAFTACYVLHAHHVHGLVPYVIVTAWSAVAAHLLGE